MPQLRAELRLRGVVQRPSQCHSQRHVAQRRSSSTAARHSPAALPRETADVAAAAARLVGEGGIGASDGGGAQLASALALLQREVEDRAKVGEGALVLEEVVLVKPADYCATGARLAKASCALRRGGGFRGSGDDFADVAPPGSTLPNRPFKAPRAQSLIKLFWQASGCRSESLRHPIIISSSCDTCLASCVLMWF